MHAPPMHLPMCKASDDALLSWGSLYAVVWGRNADRISTGV